MINPQDKELIKIELEKPEYNGLSLLDKVFKLNARVIIETEIDVYPNPMKPIEVFDKAGITEVTAHKMLEDPIAKEYLKVFLSATEITTNDMGNNFIGGVFARLLSDNFITQEQLVSLGTVFAPTKEIRKTLGDPLVSVVTKGNVKAVSVVDIEGL